MNIPSIGTFRSLIGSTAIVCFGQCSIGIEPAQRTFISVRASGAFGKTREYAEPWKVAPAVPVSLLEAIPSKPVVGIAARIASGSQMSGISCLRPTNSG